jgi:4-hydroxy-3-polyprenylbenzoate decarboxylase
MSPPRRIVVGISGSSGPIYGIRLLEAARAARGIEVHLVLSDTARRTIVLETEFTVSRVESLADVVHANHDMAAAISSGSFQTDGMVVAPCSMRSLSEIAHSATTQLITRAADVHLKERRPLILIARETPLHLGHLRNMVAATECGAIILPPVPAFYHRPRTVDDIVNQTVGKALDLLRIEHGLFRRWEGASRLTAGE